LLFGHIRRPGRGANGMAIGIGRNPKTDHSDALRPKFERQIFQKCLDRPESCADGRRTLDVARAGLPVSPMITPECCLTMWRAAERAVMMQDFTTVDSATMYSSMVRSSACFAVPYSVALGPMTLNTMSTPPALSMTLSTYVCTAVSSRASTALA
jgi:hypothetical protein